MTKGFALTVLLSAAVYALPGIASAQQYTSPMQNYTVCPGGQVWNEEAGYCQRIKVGPDGRAGGAGSQPAGSISNDAVRRMLKEWR